MNVRFSSPQREPGRALQTEMLKSLAQRAMIGKPRRGPAYWLRSKPKKKGKLRTPK